MQSPRVLIIKKHTAYEMRGAAAEQYRDTGFISENELQRILVSHQEHHQCLDTCKQLLTQHGLHYKEDFHQTNARYKGYDFVLTIGGDGTLLEASHGVDDTIPMIGIRSSGTSVGHLCICGIDQLPLLIGKIAARTIKTKKVARISARIEEAATGKDFFSNPALNDILFTNANPAATTFYNLRFKNESESQKSSGVWVSTAVGSTAGMRAAGGQVMNQLATEAQFLVREPYETEKSKCRWKQGFMNPSHDEFFVESRCEEAILALDGLHETIKIAWGDRFRIERSFALQLGTLD